jgi:predicted TPR repeat methyltransferase
MNTVSEVERFFDNTAPRYDEIVGGNGWPANDMLSEELATAQRIDQVLDLGAGTGLSSEVILRKAYPRCVVAVDVSTEMLEQLRRRCGQHPRLVIAKMAIDRFLADTQSKIDSTEIRGRLRDRCNKYPGPMVARKAVGQFLGGTQSRFDLVVAIGLFHFLPEPQQTIAEVARILTGNGQFVFTYDPYIPGHPTNGERQIAYDLTVYRSAPDDINDSLHRNGLEVVSNRIFSPQPNGNAEYQSGFVVARKI